MSEEYVRNHLADIKNYANAIENRRFDRTSDFGLTGKACTYDAFCLRKTALRNTLRNKTPVIA